MNWETLRRNVPLSLGLVLLIFYLGLLVLPSLVDLPDPMAQTLVTEANGKLMRAPFAPGEQGYWLGSDRAGRDLLSRVVYGARYTLLLAFTITIIKALIAVPVGLFIGWRRGWFGELLTVTSTATSALPSMVLVSLILWSLQVPGRPPKYWLLTYGAVIILIGVPRLAEQVRRLTEHVAVQPYIEAAIATGAKPSRILRRHILPVLRTDLVVTIAADMAWVLVMMGQLAVLQVFVGSKVFIQLGARSLQLEAQPEWGQMLGVNLDLIRTDHWWIPILPGAVLGVVVACFQLIAEGLRLSWTRRTTL